MREHCGIGGEIDPVTIEADLRRALDEAAEKREQTFLKGCKEDQYAVRIALPKCRVVYAVLKLPTDEQKSYDFVVPTVLSQEMFHTWTKTGKLGIIEDLPVEKRVMPKLKPQLCLRWSNGDGREHWGDYCADDVPEEIRQLIAKGVRRENIKVYKEVSFKINISLDDGTT
jgi:hypothetical protein